MKVVLGLGNPGTRYEGTRHNVGFRVVETLARRHGSDFRRKDAITELALVAQSRIHGEEVLLAKPRTFMNRSGGAAIALLRACAANVEDLVVVYDDADLALGRLRLRSEGSAGGHNGMKSLLASLGSPEFARVKLGVRGVGRDEVDLADYVLEDFDLDERGIVTALTGAAADAVEAIVQDGLLVAMNRFNGWAAPQNPPELPQAR